MSKNISNLSGRIGLKNNLFQKISERSLASTNDNGMKKIADQYIAVSATPKAGYLYFLECTSIHSSELGVNAKGRVSVDMMVDLKTKIQFGNVDTSDSLPLDAQFTFKKLKEIGRTQLLSLKENETGFIEINDIYNFSSHR